MVAPEKIRMEWQPQRDAVRQEVPYTSWQGFLKLEAENGNELALAVLRSRKDVADPEQAQNPTQKLFPTKDWSTHGLGLATSKVELAQEQRSIVERADLSAKGKRQLQAFMRMDEVAAQASAQGKPLGTVQRRVDGKGVVIFTLESGGSIRDTGKEVFYSGHDKAAEQVAKDYAVKKWGKHLFIRKNCIIFQSNIEHNNFSIESDGFEKQQGISR
ncbi:hypothetical protein [Desulfovibrio cuneatus]|uniref:hypothetical protein n=1 Tax=Desulfovibrio cuneatus TaxID=159728 RepID=UPI000487A9AF|nr:hypothetical protein [Desulfovibrio cuneatus]